MNNSSVRGDINAKLYFVYSNFNGDQWQGQNRATIQ